MKKLLSLMAVAIALGFVSSDRAEAIPLFSMKFQEKYAGDGANPEFAKLVKETAKCNVCHVMGEKKEVRNAYGESLHKAGLEKAFKDKIKEDEAGTTKIIMETFQKVEAEKSAAGATYGELIKSGKLPGE
jgi:hypothetical protein